MAACLITITGTSGRVLINYTESTIDKKLIAEKGNIYLDDVTVTNITYSTIEGDLIVSSACFIVTSVPFVCYKISWDYNDLVGYNFVSIDLDGIIIPITPVSFPNSKYGLASSVNLLLDDRIKITQGFSNTSSQPTNTIMIVKTISFNAPIFRIDGPDPDDSIYLIGEVVSCSNVGYTNFNTCQPIILS